MNAMMRIVSVLVPTMSLALSAPATASTEALAAALFGLIPTNHHYNVWRACPAGWCNGSCNGYAGGHSGIDIQSQTRGNEVFHAVMPGVVIATNVAGANGIAIYDAATDRTGIYLHASEVWVRVNQWVNVGTPLGRQGRAGNATGPHVHFEVRPGRTMFAACGATSTVDPVAAAMRYVFQPASGSSSGSPVTLRWSMPYATTSRVVVSTDPSFRDFVDMGGSSYCRSSSSCWTWTTSGQSTSFTGRPGSYWWRVRANNGNNGVTVWSPTLQFTIR